MAKSKKQPQGPLEGDALVKETCRRIRAAKGLWDAHRNGPCRHEREKAIALYNQLSKAQKDKIPQQLRIWLRYRSEKYFGSHQTKPGGTHSHKTVKKAGRKSGLKSGQKKRSGKRKK
ncbi:MAG: Precorrin-3B methylase [Phormidesmis sp.]